MCLEDLIRVLGLKHIKVSRKSLEVLTQSLVGNDLEEILISGLEGIPLST